MGLYGVMQDSKGDLGRSVERNGQYHQSGEGAVPRSEEAESLERTLRISLETQLLAMGVLLERTTEAMDQQSAELRSALSALESRNQRLQKMLNERDEQLRQAGAEIKKLTVSRGAVSREADLLRKDLSRLRNSRSVRIGSQIRRSIKQPRNAWMIIAKVPRVVRREVKTWRAQ